MSALVSFTWTAPAWGADLSPSRVLEGSVWFDTETGSIQPVTLVPVVDDSLNRNSRWLPKAKKIRKPPAPAAPATTGGNGSGWTLTNLLGWLLLGSLLVIGISGLIFLLSKAEFEMAGSPRKSASGEPLLSDEQTAERMKHLPVELRRTGINPRSEAERLMKAGLFDQAIILLFGHQLLLLDRHGQLRLNRGKTNRRYLGECRSANQDCSERLSKTVNAFERSYFGRKEITAPEFQELWKNNQSLEHLVTAHPEVAA